MQNEMYYGLKMPHKHQNEAPSNPAMQLFYGQSLQNKTQIQISLWQYLPSSIQTKFKRKIFCLLLAGLAFYNYVVCWPNLKSCVEMIVCSSRHPNCKIHLWIVRHLRMSSILNIIVVSILTLLHCQNPVNRTMATRRRGNANHPAISNQAQ